ncbi:MAG TPA: alpha/beta hydrolase domain-containing protein, partial [Stellaceae bacterium]|nr:alpha/beta hydrolase domain-containing protein [Stellaceae bacterium]
YEEHFNPADRFPFAYARSTDHLTGESDAILKRPDTDPLVIHTQTGTEYWQRRGSLVHTDTRGNDLAQPETVRIYLWASSQHFADPTPKKPSRGICQNYVNCVATSMLFRAALDAMDRWASEGVSPPPSRMPLRADGTLVTMVEWRERFPKLPGIAVPRGPSELRRLDFGPDFARGIATKEPPEIVSGEGYAVLVPAVDEDGNDRAGIRVPMVAAPLGTYTGWNLRARGFGHGATHEFTGSYIPFPESAEEREATGDPRRAILERYGNATAYVAAIAEAAQALVAERLMLEEDVERCIAAAAGWGRPRHDIALD